ncbi:E3 ubiquitin-protein ligase NRDP1 [Rhipicephalus microplus]|uniref:E3 ubiquitin-protein ligase NRDP1 n=1 Tax=Rhipicephalus microplus TaxID=6941 RepID=UPI00188728DB|nr:E3 ubiquitin-protein ligase NRDP1-like [Rhipicephalus microplus]
MNSPVSGTSGDSDEPTTITIPRRDSSWPSQMPADSAVYSVENFNPTPPTELVCRLCQGVLCDPVECACACRSEFCSSCMAVAPTVCSPCYTEVTTSLLVPVAPIMVNMIAKLKMDLDGLYNHLGTWDFEVVVCEGCGAEMHHSAFSMHHQREQSPKRLVRCSVRCGFPIPVNEIKDYNCRETICFAVKHQGAKLSEECDEILSQVEQLREKI